MSWQQPPQRPGGMGPGPGGQGQSGGQGGQPGGHAGQPGGQGGAPTGQPGGQARQPGGQRSGQRSGQPGGQPGGQQGGQPTGQFRQPGTQGVRQGGAPGQEPSQPNGKPEPLSLYQLLHVDRDAHVTIIRYAYRFLAAMYHPDNGETGDAEKFRIITEAWKTLSDDGRRQAYDLSLNMKEQAQGQAPHKPQPKINEFGKDSLPHIPKTGLTWNEIELRIAILQIMLAARKKKPRDGGVSMTMIMDILGVTIVETEFALWYLRERDFIETGERVFMITGAGLDYLVDQLGKTQVLDGTSELEKKTSTVVHAGLPATLR